MKILGSILAALVGLLSFRWLRRKALTDPYLSPHPTGRIRTCVSAQCRGQLRNWVWKERGWACDACGAWDEAAQRGIDPPGPENWCWSCQAFHAPTAPHLEKRR